MKRITALALLSLVAACGDQPLHALGERSSGWVTEPTVVITTTVPAPLPVVVGAQEMLWANDDIAPANLDDPDATIAEVFSRREGDRFIQASRAEIAAVLPGVSFPALVPVEAEWVSSQLVIDGDGTLSPDPSAAFGIWSAEPYTRSRSVAQLAVLRVYNDPVRARELAAADQPLSCATFADTTTERCEMLSINGRDIWKLNASAGTTLIWFENVYRYELFGRSLVAGDVLERMAAESVPLSVLAQ